MGVVLACAEWDQNLQLAVTGLQSVYHRHREIWLKSLKKNNPTGAIIASIPAFAGRTNYDLLADVSAIFNGYWDSTNINNDRTVQCTAISRSGICCYLDGLRSITGRAEMMRIVHVLPGHIQRGHRQYDSVYDGDSCAPDVASVQLESLETPEPKAISRCGSIEAKAMVMERGTEQSLIFYYKVTIQDVSVFLQPGRLTQKILLRTGILTCAKGPGCKNELMLPCAVVKEGWQVTEETERNLKYSSG